MTVLVRFFFVHEGIYSSVADYNSSRVGVGCWMSDVGCRMSDIGCMYVYHCSIFNAASWRAGIFVGPYYVDLLLK